MSLFRTFWLLALGCFLALPMTVAASMPTGEPAFETVRAAQKWPAATGFFAFFELFEQTDQSEDGPETEDDAPDGDDFQTLFSTDFLNARPLDSLRVFQKFDPSVFFSAAAARPALFDLFCCWKGLIA